MPDNEVRTCFSRSPSKHRGSSRSKLAFSMGTVQDRAMSRALCWMWNGRLPSCREHIRSDKGWEEPPKEAAADDETSELHHVVCPLSALAPDLNSQAPRCMEKHYAESERNAPAIIFWLHCVYSFPPSKTFRFPQSTSFRPVTAENKADSDAAVISQHSSWYNISIADRHDPLPRSDSFNVYPPIYKNQGL